VKLQTHMLVLGGVFNLIPDLIISWAVASQDKSAGWPVFFTIFFLLQAIYLFVWFRRVGWGWVSFWLFRKRWLAANLGSPLVAGHFPPPDESTIDLDDYLGGIANNQGIDAELRLKAVFQLGMFEALKSQGLSTIIQLRSAGNLALKRFRNDRYAGRHQH
jgi:hypothetical protein